ncbi:INCENP [Bugula neritina]|uniref:INCENP n=1 Tax=Bugula neritina TaxID=10212 RepID=A0A7J7J767_BUGNE|nr:INCENP [Bugula neritina]
MARKKEYSEAERQRKIQEAERHKIIEAAKQETLRKMEMDRLNQGKSKQTTAGTPSTSTSKPKTSIYEVLSNKAAAMSEQRKALMTTLTESSSSKKTDDKLNATFTKPERQNFIDIKLTHEDDEFDDPKFAKCKKPAWAEGSQFNTAVISQYEALKTGRLQPSNVFGKFACCMPDLTKMFPVHKPRFFHRTSSAKWSSPPLNNERRASKRVKR